MNFQDKTTPILSLIRVKQLAFEENIVKDLKEEEIKSLALEVISRRRMDYIYLKDTE